MKRCVNCKWWGDVNSGSRDNWRECDNLKDEKFLSGWCYDSCLYYETSPDFGCVLWELI